VNAKPAVLHPSRPAETGRRVLMLSDVYFPRINGVSTSIRASVKSLVRAGHAVTLVAPDYGIPAQRRHDDEFGDRFEVLRVPARRIVFDPEDRLMHKDALQRLMPRLAARDWMPSTCTRLFARTSSASACAPRPAAR
jgi:hypothetical protein